MPADALWTLSMALNVYLTFFHRYGTLDLRRLEYYYLSLNYGIPMIPALVYVFVETEKRGHIFGDATVSLSPPRSTQFSMQAHHLRSCG
jgi:hypothetical protein